MTGRQLEDLLHELSDTREVVVSRVPEGDVALAVWRAAEGEATQAFGEWQRHGGADGYAAYRAAADRADAAAEALAA
jgi:hypothetical protein